MKIRVTTEFEVKEEDKFNAAAAIENAAKAMVVEVGNKSECASINLTFPRGPKEVATKKKAS